MCLWLTLVLQYSIADIGPKAVCCMLDHYFALFCIGKQHRKKCMNRRDEKFLIKGLEQGFPTRGVGYYSMAYKKCLLQ